MKIERLDQIRENSHLLPFSDGMVVRDLADEIELLCDELRRRDKVVDELVETLQMKVEECRKIGAPYDSGFHAPQEIILLKHIRMKNMEIHDDLRLSPESTESEVSDA